MRVRFSEKLTLRWSLACRVFIKEGPWDPLPRKGEEGSRSGRGQMEELSCGLDQAQPWPSPEGALELQGLSGWSPGDTLQPSVSGCGLPGDGAASARRLSAPEPDPA